jgi:diguanylate cyclase (GGDEF)-like protein/PAS domain S-box-containing protein
MKSFSLKKRIMIPFIVVGLATFVVGANFVNHLEEHQKINSVVQDAEALQSHLRSMLDAKAEVMAASLYFIVKNKGLVSALKAGDRKALLALGSPIYERLNKRNNVTHFYFHNAKRVNVLRVHKPKKYGDTINRITALGAEKSGKLFSGIELGPLGTFTLRSVLPVFDAGKLIGYMELGQEIDNIIQDARGMFDIELFMLIDKQYLVQSAWEVGMRMLGRPFDWNELSTTVLVSQSLPNTPLAALDRIGGKKYSGITIGQNILLDGHTYASGIVPLNDAGDRPVAMLVMLLDLTELISNARMELATFTGISAAMGLAILVLFYFVLGRTEEALRESIEANKLLLDAAGEGIYGVDMQGDSIFINPAACRMLGYEEGELIGQPMHAAIHHSYPDGTPYPREECHMYKAFKDVQNHHVADEVLWRKDGSSFPVEYLSTPVLKNGKVSGAVVVFTDITERKKAEEAIERSINIQRALDTMLNISLPPLTLKEVLSASLDAILSVPKFAILNKGAIFLTVKDESSLEMMVHKNLPDSLLQSCALLPFGKCLCGKAAATREIVFVDHLSDEHDIRYDGIQPHGHYCIPIMLENKLLGVLNIYVAAGHVSDAEEKAALKTVADTLGVVIERKQAEEALKKLAHNDILTGLPNRILFYDRMEQAQAFAQRHSKKFGLLFLDLDHFKEINDTLGHDMGDAVLKMAADRLLGCVRATDTVSRMGGDEFTVILTETKVPENVELVANNILKALSEPFILNGKPHEIGCSIGISIYPDDGRDSETLVKNADVAMYNAKRQRNTYYFFTDDLKGEA